MRMLLLAVTIAVVLGGCSSDDASDTATAASSRSGSSSTSTTIAASELVPASDVLPAVKPATLGAPVEVGNGLSATVTNPRPGGDEDGPWVVVDVRVSNQGADDGRAPVIVIACDDLIGEDTQADQTLDTFANVLPGTFIEGTLHLLLPGDARIGEPVTMPCPDPVRLRVGSDDAVHEIPIDRSALPPGA